MIKQIQLNNNILVCLFFYLMLPHQNKNGFTFEKQEMEIVRKIVKKGKGIVMNTPRHTIDFLQVEPEEVYEIKMKRSNSPHSLSVPKKGGRKYETLSEDSIGPSNETTIEEHRGEYYHNIASITEQENKNLKEQNMFLTREVKKMQEREKKMKEVYEKAKKYKHLYQQAAVELEVAKQQCEANKIALAEMKKITKIGIYEIESKMDQYYPTQYQPTFQQIHKQKKYQLKYAQ